MKDLSSAEEAWDVLIGKLYEIDSDPRSTVMVLGLLSDLVEQGRVRTVGQVPLLNAHGMRNYEELWATGFRVDREIMRKMVAEITAIGFIGLPIGGL
jgi:hypothetical protein